MDARLVSIRSTSRSHRLVLIIIRPVSNRAKVRREGVMPTSVAGRVRSGSGSRLRLRVTLSGHDLRLVSRSRQQLVLRELRQVVLEHQVRVLNRLALEELQEREARSVSRTKQEAGNKKEHKQKHKERHLRAGGERIGCTAPSRTPNRPPRCCRRWSGSGLPPCSSGAPCARSGWDPAGHSGSTSCAASSEEAARAAPPRPAGSPWPSGRR